MLDQIGLGSALIVITILAGGGAYAAMETVLTRNSHWLHTEPHGPKLILVLLTAIFWTLAMMTWNV